ncbi:MAG: chitobiase/beta-hexosaminidase C-terminal domain-containing protein, partial [Candidatus Terrybacteria bacterium]|nr:chitobiase/beta-hexosaminidase C-terminal domain-containing protein [Candidatus Terrybacteria bacterium]
WVEKAFNDYIKPIAITILRKAILDRIVDQIIAWISGEGDPQFVTDWQGFLKDAGEQAGGFFLQELIGKNLMAGLCQPNWAIKIKISLGKPKRFSTRAMCTFKDIEKNIKDFFANFSNGGWASWIKITESQNNPYGLYLMALNEKLDREIKKVAGVEKEAAAGGGFFSDKVCKKRECYTADDYGHYIGPESETGTWTKKDAEGYMGDGISCECTQWEANTPGQTMLAGLNKSLFKDMDWLVNSEMWQSYVVQILDAMVNRLVKEGVTALVGLAGSEAEKDWASEGVVSEWAGTIDTTPPTTEARPFSANQVEIVATSKEPEGSMVKIYYTTDGSEPTNNLVSGDLISGISPLYVGPITISGPTNLKWFGIDLERNKEGVHSQFFTPPFVIVDTTKPSTFAFAVSATEIALVTVPFEPTTIYYTLNGTEPTTLSNRYIKTLNVSAVPTLKWFTMDKAGNQETVQTLTISTPLSDIKDLVVPNANISAPATAQANNFFRLDPSGSADFDSTPRIVMYEWDFDNDGNYDWWTIDWNRDGVFDESQCRSGAICTEPSSGILNGFLGMQVPAGAPAGVVDVKYQAGFARTIGLRVTDDEGLWSAGSVVIDVQ